MSARRTKRRPRVPETPPLSLSEQVSNERDRLCKAASIIDCCRLACASLLEGGGNPEVMADALQAAHDLVEESFSALEMTAEALETISFGRSRNKKSVKRSRGS